MRHFSVAAAASGTVGTELDSSEFKRLLERDLLLLLPRCKAKLHEKKVRFDARVVAYHVNKIETTEDKDAMLKFHTSCTGGCM